MDIKIYEVQPDDQQMIQVLLDKFIETFPEYTYYQPQIRESIVKGVDLNPKVFPHHWVVECEDHYVGFTLFNYIPAGNIGFGRYIGIDSEYRKRGAGFDVIQQIIKQLADDTAAFGHPPSIGLCAEVQMVQEAQTDDENRENEERLHFFTATCGAKELNLDYLEPPGIEGKMLDTQDIRTTARPMHLLLFPMDEDIQLADSQTTQVVRSIYTDHYLLEPDSSLVQDVLSTVGNGTRLYQPGG